MSAEVYNPNDPAGQSLFSVSSNTLRVRTDRWLRADRFSVGTTAAHSLHVASTSAVLRNLFSDHTLGDIGSNGTMYSGYFSLNYRATDVGTPTTIGGVGFRSVVNVGTAGGIAATGSVLGIAAEMYVANTAQAGSEQAPLFGVLRYDNTAVGRGWLTDYTVHGTITTQQEILTGVNVVLANYFNGQPSENPSCAFSASAGTAIGGSLDSAHSAATRYPGGDGYWVGGLVAGGTGRGFNVGFRAGGAGGPWNVQTSKLGTGFQARDYDTAGLHLLTRSGSTAPAIHIAADAGHVLMFEQSDAAAPAANSGALYVRDNGSGKTQLVVRFPTGAIQVIATEP